MSFQWERRDYRLKPQRMIDHLWNLEYNRIWGHQGISIDHLSKGLKCYPREFSRLPYYKQLQIVHLFDTVHIGKNVIEILWKILDGRRDKEKLIKFCSDIHDSNHAMKNIIESNSNGDWINASALPWLLTEQQSNSIKEVIQKMRFPIGFSMNIRNLISKKSEFGPMLKMHDWHTFIKVNHDLLYLQYIYEIAFNFHCITLENNEMISWQLL